MNLLHIVATAHPSPQSSHATIPDALKAAGQLKSQLYSTSEHAADLKRIIEAHPAGTIDFMLVELTADTAAAAQGEGHAAVAAASSSSSAPSSADSHDRPGDASFLQLLHALCRTHRTAFICVSTNDARGIEDARFRWNCFEQRVQMVTVSHAAADLTTALGRVSKLREERLAAAAAGSAGSSQPKHAPRCYKCPVCEQAGLPEDTLHAHLPLFHANFAQRKPIECPICRRTQRSFGPHMQNDHGPPSRGEAPCEHVILNVVNPVVLCVVRRPSDGKFLMVQEFASSGFWLPGGRAENGESLQEAAKREAKEEAGVDIELTGLLTVEYHSAAEPAPGSGHRSGMTKLIVVFLGRPTEPLFHTDSGSQQASSLCKTVPDFESCGSVWVRADELDHIKVRFNSPSRTWFKYVEAGGEVHSLSILQSFLSKDAGRVPERKHAPDSAASSSAPAAPHSAL